MLFFYYYKLKSYSICSLPLIKKRNEGKCQMTLKLGMKDSLCASKHVFIECYLILSQVKV